MPLLAGLIEYVVGGLVAWLAEFLARKVATAVAVGASVAVAWTVCYAALKAIWSGLGLAIPPSLLDPLLLVKPTRFDTILAAWIAGKVAIAGYRWAKETSLALASSSSGATGAGKATVASAGH